MKNILVATDMVFPAGLAAQVEAVLKPHGGRFVNGLIDASTRRQFWQGDGEGRPDPASFTPPEVMNGIEVLCATDMSAERFGELKGLKWMHCPFAGVNRLLAVPVVVQSPVTLTNGSGVMAGAVADQVMAFVLMFSRQMYPQFLAQQQRRWVANEIHGIQTELVGQTLGLIGYGRIGADIAHRAKSFGMRVIATRERVDQPAPDLDQALPTDKLNDLLAQSDFVVVTAALTPQTQGMLGTAQFAVMKPTAYLINIARGPLIREAELVTALQENRMAGAGLDVFETEPLAADSPLWETPNVIITPHTAGGFNQFLPRSVQFFCRQLQHYLNEEPLENIVDKKRGY